MNNVLKRINQFSDLFLPKYHQKNQNPRVSIPTTTNTAQEIKVWRNGFEPMKTRDKKSIRNHQIN